MACRLPALLLWIIVVVAAMPMDTRALAPLLKARFLATWREALWYSRAKRGAAVLGRPERPRPRWRGEPPTRL